MKKNGQFVASSNKTGTCSGRGTFIPEAEIDFLKKEAGKGPARGLPCLACMQKSEDQLHRQSTFLLSLTARGSWRRTDLKTALEEITKICSELIQTEHVNVWWYNDDCSVISCYELHEASTKTHSSGEELQMIADG